MPVKIGRTVFEKEEMVKKVKEESPRRRYGKSANKTSLKAL